MRGLAGLLAVLTPSLLFAQSPSLPVVIVDSVSLTAGSSVSSQHLEKMEEGICNHTYAVGRENEIADRANYELKKDGYFKAETTVEAIQVLSATPAGRWVSVTLRSNEGQQYRLHKISFKNNKVFNAGQLRDEFHLAGGDVFDVDKVRIGLEDIRKLYAFDGYLDVTPVPVTTADDQARAVDLTIDMEEGGQYTMESLSLSGPEEWPADKTERLLQVWRPFAERVYSPNLIEQLQQAMMEMFPGITSDEAMPSVRMNQERKTVSFELALPEKASAN